MKKKIIKILLSMGFDTTRAYFEPLLVGIEILIKKPLKANNIYQEICDRVGKTLNTVSFNMFTAKEEFFKAYEDNQFKYVNKPNPFEGMSLDIQGSEPKEFLVILAQYIAEKIRKQ